MKLFAQQVIRIKASSQLPTFGKLSLTLVMINLKYDHFGALRWLLSDAIDSKVDECDGALKYIKLLNNSFT